MVAMSLILEFLVLYRLPNGGSVTLSALPIVFFAVRHGMGWGAMAGFVFGGLNYIVGNGIAIDWTTIICDYFLAFCLLGLGAGMFKGRKGGAYAGTVVGVSLQFLASYLVGVFVWGKWMPEEFLGLLLPVQHHLGPAGYGPDPGGLRPAQPGGPDQKVHPGPGSAVIPPQVKQTARDFYESPGLLLF